MPVDKIYINFPSHSIRENTGYVIPAELEPYANFCETDYGPITKLIPVLEKEPDNDTLIVCIDDDKIYDKNLIAYLYAFASYTNFQACVCNAGWNYINLFGQFALPIIATLPYSVNEVSILQCFKGVMYRRSFFEPDFQPSENCFSTDDIAISRYLQSKNISIYAFPGYVKHEDIETPNESKLSVTNLRNNAWIKCIKSFQ